MGNSTWLISNATRSVALFHNGGQKCEKIDSTWRGSHFWRERSFDLNWVALEPQYSLVIVLQISKIRFKKTQFFAKNVKINKKSCIFHSFLARWRHLSTTVQSSFESIFYYKSNKLLNVQIDKFFQKLCKFEVFAKTKMEILLISKWGQISPPLAC